MRLHVDGQDCTFVSLVAFCQQHGLPPTFGVAFFQPKVLDGLGSLDRAGSTLNRVTDAALAAVPPRVPAAAWLDVVPRLAAAFETALVGVNDRVGLRESEIAFAVAGFGDVCSAYGLALFRARSTRTAPPDFGAVYADWLYGTVHLGGEEAPFNYNDDVWLVRVVHHAYGRVGLQITTPEETYYVVDKALACPAEGYMLRLLRAVTARMQAATE